MQQKPTAVLPPLSPPLKWAGGKRWLLPYLEPFWQHHQDRRLVEPFCGGLAVTLGLQPKRALLNDINPHLINFYRWLKHGLMIEIELLNDKTAFYNYRNTFNELIRSKKSNSQEAAALFYYLNRTCFNGLCRFNQSGEFNVPFGRYKRINYTRDFTEYSKVLSHWEFTNQDFEGIALDANDFVYADPPYDVEFTQYSKDGFSWDDQVRLVEWLTQHPGPVVLSNQATQRVVALYEKQGFDLLYLDAPRRISCNGDRTPAQEVLAIKGIKKWREIPKLVPFWNR